MKEAAAERAARVANTIRRDNVKRVKADGSFWLDRLLTAEFEAAEAPEVVSEPEPITSPHPLDEKSATP